MDKKLKLEKLIKNQKNCIAFKEATLSNILQRKFSKRCVSIVLGIKRDLQKLKGGLRAYQDCYELFYSTPPAATSDLEYSENLPNQEGHYWMRSKSGLETVKRVFFNHMDELCIWATNPRGGNCTISVERLKNSQWAGPIAHPVK